MCCDYKYTKHTHKLHLRSATMYRTHRYCFGPVLIHAFLIDGSVSTLLSDFFIFCLQEFNSKIIKNHDRNYIRRRLRSQDTARTGVDKPVAPVDSQEKEILCIFFIRSYPETNRSINQEEEMNCTPYRRTQKRVYFATQPRLTLDNFSPRYLFGISIRMIPHFAGERVKRT